MGFRGIALYTGRAFLFALAVAGVWALILRLRGKPAGWGRLLSAFYLAALVEITVLRGGVDVSGLLNAAREPAQWVPLRTTLGELRLGAWPFTYHVLGNLLWFLPLGLMLRRSPARRTLLVGALLSLSIECLQWLLMTGMPDVDDVLLNVCGALAGWLLFHWIPVGRGKIRSRRA